jgi:transposase InsO family protein
VRTKEGWLYVATMLDLFSQRVVGWSVSERYDARLMGEALERAVREGLARFNHAQRSREQVHQPFPPGAAETKQDEEQHELKRRLLG